MVLQRLVECGSVLQRLVECRSVLQRVVECGSVLQCMRAIHQFIFYVSVVVYIFPGPQVGNKQHHSV